MLQNSIVSIIEEFRNYSFSEFYMFGEKNNKNYREDILKCDFSIPKDAIEGTSYKLWCDISNEIKLLDSCIRDGLVIDEEDERLYELRFMQMIICRMENLIIKYYKLEKPFKTSSEIQKHKRRIPLNHLYDVINREIVDKCQKLADSEENEIEIFDMLFDINTVLSITKELLLRIKE